MPAAARSTALANPYWGDDWPEVRALWPLEPGRAHLNHGSFGATPTPVLAAQGEWQVRAAANPMRYYLLDEPAGVAAGRRLAARLIGSDDDGVALVANATTAASTVLAALALQPGDEVVLTDHCYGAVRMAVRRVAAATGARVVEVEIPVGAGAAEIVEHVAAALSDHTALVVIDQITSPTARVFPVAAIVQAAHAAGAPVFVDAAHVPAQIDVDVRALGADFWTGNFHKWACAAPGTAALHVAPYWRRRVPPLVTSWADAEGFPAAFDLSGTRDLTAWLALDAAVDLLGRLTLPRLRAHGTALAAYGQDVLADALGVEPARLWADDELWMRCVPLPVGTATTEDGKRALWQRISDELGCEVAITSWAGRSALRISAHAYNAPAEYDRLATGLRSLL